MILDHIRSFFSDLNLIWSKIISSLFKKIRSDHYFRGTLVVLDILTLKKEDYLGKK
jgi:hypothetical protein